MKNHIKNRGNFSSENTNKFTPHYTEEQKQIAIGKNCWELIQSVDLSRLSAKDRSLVLEGIGIEDRFSDRQNSALIKNSIKKQGENLKSIEATLSHYVRIHGGPGSLNDSQIFQKIENSVCEFHPNMTKTQSKWVKQTMQTLKALTRRDRKVNSTKNIFPL